MSDSENPMDSLLGRRQTEVEAVSGEEKESGEANTAAVPDSKGKETEKKELIELRRQQREERRRKATAKRPMTIHVTVEAYEALQDLYFTSRTEKTNLVEEALRDYYRKRSKDVEGFSWDPYEG